MSAGHGSARPRGFALRRRGVLAGHEQRELELAGSLVQGQQAPPVGLQADHGAHLAGGAALLVGKPHERRERARLAVGRGPRAGGCASCTRTSCAARGSTPRVPALDPAVYGGGGDLELPHAQRRDVRRREPTRDVRPDGGVFASLNLNKWLFLE